MNKIINIYEAKTHFSELVNAVMDGSEIFIAKAGKPVVKIVPLKSYSP
jgi:prevent-host-death family protein